VRYANTTVHIHSVLRIFQFGTYGRANLEGSSVTFSSLTGENGDLFSVYTESGFTVTPVGGRWSKAFFFGNPVPDIFCDACAPGIVAVTSDSGPFMFESVDVGNPGNDPVNFSIEGFLNGILQFSQAGTLTSPDIFQTFSSDRPNVVIDSLTISLTGSDYNIDNIVVDAVPEPGTMVLALAGIATAPFFRSTKAPHRDST
jgi:hypothetical protein